MRTTSRGASSEVTILTVMPGRSWTSREIASQAITWNRALDLVDETRELIAAPGERVLAIGCGTSAFVAQVYAELRESAGLGETDWAFAGDPLRRRHYDRVVAITRSGTTTEVLKTVVSLPASSRVVGVAGVLGGPIDGLVDDMIFLDFANEQSVVQTRFPTTLITLLRAALGIDVTQSLFDVVAVLDEPVPVDVMDFDHYVHLGSGWTLGLAHEAALKVRETAQAWSESYPAMEYRHGPIAAAGQRTLVSFYGEPPRGLVGAIEALGVRVLADERDPLAQLVRAQRIALLLAGHRNLDPEHPRRLTRSVILDPDPSRSTS